MTKNHTLQSTARKLMPLLEKEFDTPVKYTQALRILENLNVNFSHAPLQTPEGSPLAPASFSSTMTPPTPQFTYEVEYYKHAGFILGYSLEGTPYVGTIPHKMWKVFVRSAELVDKLMESYARKFLALTEGKGVIYLPEHRVPTLTLPQVQRYQEENREETAHQAALLRNGFLESSLLAEKYHLPAGMVSCPVLFLEEGYPLAASGKRDVFSISFRLASEEPELSHPLSTKELYSSLSDFDDGPREIYLYEDENTLYVLHGSSYYLSSIESRERMTPEYDVVESMQVYDDPSITLGTVDNHEALWEPNRTWLYLRGRSREVEQQLLRLTTLVQQVHETEPVTILSLQSSGKDGENKKFCDAFHAYVSTLRQQRKSGEPVITSSPILLVLRDWFTVLNGLPLAEQQLLAQDTIYLLKRHDDYARNPYVIITETRAEQALEDEITGFDRYLGVRPSRKVIDFAWVKENKAITLLSSQVGRWHQAGDDLATQLPEIILLQE